MSKKELNIFKLLSEKPWEAAQAAIDALNDSEQQGRNLRVNQARPRERRD